LRFWIRDERFEILDFRFEISNQLCFYPAYPVHPVNSFSAFYFIRQVRASCVKMAVDFKREKIGISHETHLQTYHPPPYGAAFAPRLNRRPWERSGDTRAPKNTLNSDRELMSRACTGLQRVRSEA
jgi:hypothetical protein